MKRFLLPLWLGCSALVAADAPKPLLAEGETVITSESGAEFFMETKLARYHGKVRVDNPKLKLDCEHLTIKSAEEGGGIDSIVAETNVVITMIETNRTTTAHSAKAVYTAAANQLFLSGGDTLLESEPAHLQMWAPTITIDLANKKLLATPPVRTKIPAGAFGKLGQEGINLKPAAPNPAESKK